MKFKKRYALKLLSFFICLLVLFTLMPQAYANKSFKVVFAGNTSTPNPMIKPYSELVGTYLKEILGNTEIVSVPVIDIDNNNFIAETEQKIVSENPDIVFLEIDISKKYKCDEQMVREKTAAIAETLLKAEKTPAIYFVYAPEETFFDNRKPFDDVADYYGINVFDLYSPLKAKYAEGQLETKDFLTAGIIPGEGGHEIFAELIINALKGTDDLLKTPIGDKKEFVNPEKYKETILNIESSKPTSEGTVFYVAENGSDSNSGTIDAPFKTLEHAKKAVKEIKATMGVSFSGATVYIREGTYQLKKGFVLNKEDGGTDSAKVVYSGYPGETVRFTNGEFLKHDRFKLVSDTETLKRIRKEAHGKVYVYDLAGTGINPGYYKPNDVNHIGGSSCRNYSLGSILTADGKLEQRAQYPNGGYSKVSDAQLSSNTDLYYSEDVGERWLTADNARINGKLGQGYYAEWTKIKEIDAENKIITLKASTPYGVKAGYPWAIVNLLEELDMPSEWYIDEAKGLLYYYPRGDVKESEIIFSSNTDPIITLNETKNVTIKNIQFTTGCGTAVKIIDGVGNTVDSCKIGNMGFCAVEIMCNDIAGTGKNGVINSHIYNTAVSGVMINGGDRKALTPQEDYVENCHIENFATEANSEAAGVLAIGTVGAIIRNNNIHNDDSCAAWMGGNDDYIAYNEIYNVVKETDDYGAIYGDARGALRQGVTVVNNYFHDIVYSSHAGTTGQVNGFYSDALRNNGAKVNNNAFVDVQGGIFFANNHNMMAKGNLFLDSVKYSINAYHGVYTASQRENYYNKVRESLENGSFWNAKSETQAPETLLYRAYRNGNDALQPDNEQVYYLKYPWLEHYLESKFLEVSDIIVNNNAIFGDDDYIKMPNESRELIHTKDNYVTNERIAMPESGSHYDRLDEAMKIADEKLPEFEVWDARKAGIDKTNIQISDFDILYPVNGQTDIASEEVVLRWDYSSGADEYKVVVATDPNFKNIVFEKVCMADNAHVTGLKAGSHRYYWKVTASSQSEKFVGNPDNANGVYSFVTARQENIDKTELDENINTSKAVLAKIVEGSQTGQYPEGTINELTAAIDEATAWQENFRCSQKDVEEASKKLYAATQKVLSKAALGEVDFSEIFNSPATIGYVEQGKSEAKTESENITQSGNGVTFSGRGGAFASRTLEPYEIAHFKAKFDFGGIASGYTIFGLRAQNYTGYMHNVSSYVFLVTKDAIELQAFKKPTNVGKMYLSVPNTFIQEGKEHDIEFAAIPVNDGLGVRLILVVDGQIVYDELDEINIITQGGYAGFANSGTNCNVTVMPPDKNLSYPLLIDRLKDPNSELNKK